MNELRDEPNPDLQVGDDNQERMSQPDHRRHGYHNRYRLTRYGCSFRAARVLTLSKNMDPRIADLEVVRRLTSLPWFSAMVVLRGQEVLFERYAPDFGPDRPHVIQSISKSTMNLIIGELVDQGSIDLSRRVEEYLPWIGTGYAGATIQQVLNMDVANDYTEDYWDPAASCYAHKEAYGWRLPAVATEELNQRRFLATIASEDIVNKTGVADYKSANTDVLAMVAEAASGAPIRQFFADLSDAIGVEDALYITTDRDGFPAVNGGICLTARDLARYALMFIRGGLGVGGKKLGSAAFIDQSRRGGVPVGDSTQVRYSNQLYTDGRWVGHSGHGGQFMLADLTSGVVVVFLSVLENRSSSDDEYKDLIAEMCATVGRLDDAG